MIRLLTILLLTVFMAQTAFTTNTSNFAENNPDNPIVKAFNLFDKRYVGTEPACMEILDEEPCELFPNDYTFFYYGECNLYVRVRDLDGESHVAVPTFTFRYYNKIDSLVTRIAAYVPRQTLYQEITRKYPFCDDEK